MDITILNGQTEDVEAILSNNAYGACPYWEAQHYKQINGESTFSFTAPGDHRDSEYIIEGALVAFLDADEDFQLFEIVRVEEVHGDVIDKKVTCEHQFISEMNDDFISYLVMAEKTAASMIASILAFGITSRWLAGTIVATSTETVKIELASKTEAIYSLTQVFGLEWKFRVTIGSNGAITGRYIDLLSQVGSDNGKRFEYTKDIVNLERDVETYEMKTALYGFGKSEEVPGGIRRIGFNNVIWTTAGGDPAAKPAGQIYIEDPTAKAAYGRVSGTRNRIGFYSNPDQTDPSALLTETWTALQSNNSPRIEYRMTALDLEVLTGYGFEAVRLGDTVNVIDHLINPDIEFTTRIQEITYNYSELEKTQVTLQNETRKITFMDGSKIQENKFKIDNRQGVWQENGYSGNMLVDHSFELMRTTETAPDSTDGSYLISRPLNQNINTWYWGNTTAPSTKNLNINPGPRFISEFVNGINNTSQLNRTPQDFQAIVVGTSRRNPKQLAFISETIGLNGPYAYSAYISSFPGTTIDGKARLEVWAMDFVGGMSHRISKVGSADYDLLANPANWYKWTRVAVPNIRNLPTSTVYLEISLTQSSSSLGMRYLADGVQLVPVEQPVTYQPESSLWGLENGIYGTFNRNTYIQAYPSSVQISPAGTSFVLNFKRLSTENDPGGYVGQSEINDPLNEWSTANGSFHPYRNGIYHIDCSVRWGAGITGGLITHFVEVDGTNRAALSYQHGMQTDSMTNGSVTMYIKRGSTVKIVGYTSIITSINSSERMTRLRIKRQMF